MLNRKSASGPVIVVQSFPASAASPNGGPALVTIDWSRGPVQRLTLVGTCQIAQTGLPAGESVPGLKLEITQGAGGPYQVLFLGTKTPGGQGINLSSSVGALDVVQLFWDGFRPFASVQGLDWGP